MSEKSGAKSKKDVLKMIGKLSELEINYFKEGVVDVLKLLYEQDVTMTNVIEEKLDKLNSQIEMLKGFMFGMHIATLQHVKGDGLGSVELKEIASVYEIDYDKLRKVISTGTLLEVLGSIKENLR